MSIDYWPGDVDGNVFRSLSQQEFDFSKEYLIDFYIDFNNRVSNAVINALREKYPEVNIIVKNNEEPPYVQIQIWEKLDYDYVIKVQSELTAAMKPFGGWCESWGVLH